MIALSLSRLVRELSGRGISLLFDQLALIESQQELVFLEQSVVDALGGEGYGVCRHAAFEASHALLGSHAAASTESSPAERLSRAAELFAAMGQGRLVFDVRADGGTVRGEHLLAGSSVKARHEGRAAKQPADPFAAGFVAAAASHAFPSDWGAFEAEEVECVARRAEACKFVLSRRAEPPRLGTVVSRAAVEALPLEPSPAASMDAARAHATAVRQVGGLLADARGVVEGFGGRLAVVPVSYAAQIAVDTMHLVGRRTPELESVFTALVRESAQMGACLLIGGILASGAWRERHGPPALDPRARLEQMLGVARALGWGLFTASELQAGTRLVLQSALTPESAHHLVRHGATTRRRLARQQGLALGLTQMLRPGALPSGRTFGMPAYLELLRAGPRLHVEETRSPLRGDPLCEVTVEVVR